jgi:AraC-like DNA-binding protein
MDVLYEQITKESECSINFLEAEVPCLIVPWHFHPETEIIYVEKSHGSRFVGDHSEPFEEGDVGLIGANLPHVRKSASIYRNNIPGLSVRVLVVHFDEAIFTDHIALLPEMQGIKKLLHESQLRIKFYGSARTSIGKLMQGIRQTTGITKVLKLIELLDFMSKTEERQLLASMGYSNIRKSVDFDRFDKAHRYMIDHFQQSISLETVSATIGMTPTPFCRYFKKHTIKSFNTVLNEIRIGHACKLQLENKMNISGIGFESGFNNLSNFNEQFKKIMGVSPSQYICNREKPS